MKMKNIILISLFISVLFASCIVQKDDSFSPLFNGKNLDNWTLDEDGGFKVIKDELFTGSFGESSNLFTKEWYCNYVLRLEYMLSHKGNSGVLIRCDPQAPWETGVEVQLLAPWTPRRDDLHCTGSLYGHVAVTNRPNEATEIWHKMEIKCDRKTIRVSVDDTITTLANIDSVPGLGGKLLCGAIGLQVNHADIEGQYAKFRNIHIMDLDSDPEYVSGGFYENDTRIRRQAHAAAISLGAIMIEPLSIMMSQDNPVAKSSSRQVLFDIAARATSPQTAEFFKNDIAVALKNSAENTSSEVTKNYLEWLSGMIIY